MANVQNEKKADRKIRLRKEAEERNASYAVLTKKEKLDRLNAGGYSAKKQRDKLGG